MILDVIRVSISDNKVEFVRIPRGCEGQFNMALKEVYSLSPKVEIKNIRDENEKKLKEIWKLVNNAYYLKDMKERNFYNLIHDIADTINPGYEEIGVGYLE